MNILYNTEFYRWEVYGKHPVIRGGEPQPCFVNADIEKCEAYVEKVEGTK